MERIAIFVAVLFLCLSCLWVLVVPIMLLLNEGKAYVSPRDLLGTEKSAILEKPFPGGMIRLEMVERAEQWTLIDETGVERRSWHPPNSRPQWIDVDASGRIVFGENGRLWAWRDFPSGEPVMIADLNDNVFEEMHPPAWALEW